MSPNLMLIGSKKINSIVLFTLISVGSFQLGFAADTSSNNWNIEKIEKLITEIKSHFESVTSGPHLHGKEELAQNKFLDQLKIIAVNLANNVQQDFESLKTQVIPIVQGLVHLKDEKVVTAAIDVPNQTARVSFHTHFPKDLADELGVDQNYQLAEVIVPFKNLFNN